jgi:hypothetical protein
MNLPITHCRDFLRAPPFPLATDACIGSTIESATDYLDGKDVHCFIFFLICFIHHLRCFIHHLRLGFYLFRRGWQLLKARLDENRPGEKKKAAICRPPIGRERGCGHGKSWFDNRGIFVGSCSWGPSLAP